MANARVGERVRMLVPGWEALDGHEGVVDQKQPGPFPYIVRCDDGAVRHYRAEEVRVIQPRLNGVRVVHMSNRRDYTMRWASDGRWPERVRTCRGSRR